jgi:hypothetical protein
VPGLGSAVPSSTGAPSDPSMGAMVVLRLMGGSSLGPLFAGGRPEGWIEAIETIASVKSGSPGNKSVHGALLRSRAPFTTPEGCATGFS